MKLEPISKMHLTPKGIVVNRFKMLEYRGKMPLPQVFRMGDRQIALITNMCKSGF